MSVNSGKYCAKGASGESVTGDLNISKTFSALYDRSSNTPVVAEELILEESMNYLPEATLNI
jgi:hypothetical protein